MADKLTVKQTKFVKAYVANDGNGQEAAKAAYNVANNNSARQIASETLTKPNVKEAIDSALAKHNITIDAAIKPIKDGLEATRQIGFGDDALETVDHTTRLKASGMALKLMGADKGEAQTPASVHFHQHIEDKKAGYEF